MFLHLPLLANRMLLLLLLPRMLDDQVFLHHPSFYISSNSQGRLNLNDEQKRQIL
jgi:hypothetical protein